jgi:hypothetical protein
MKEQHSVVEQLESEKEDSTKEVDTTHHLTKVSTEVYVLYRTYKPHSAQTALPI